MLAFIFFIICILLSSLFLTLSSTLSFFATISLSAIFFKQPNKLFLFTLFCFITESMFAGSFFGLTFDLNLTSKTIYTVSNLCFSSLFIIVILQTLFVKKNNSRQISLSDGLIKSILVFLSVQFFATSLSIEFQVSINKFLSLMQMFIWFYICLFFIHRIKTIELLDFLGFVALIIGLFYIYNVLILGENYNDDGNILYILPFWINILSSQKIKIFSKISSVFIAFSIFLTDSRRLLIATLLYLNNYYYRLFSRKLNYFLIAGTVVTLFFVYRNVLGGDSNLRIFDSINIILKAFSGESLSNADKYSLFTRRNVLNLIGINLFLENPILGAGLGMNTMLAGQSFFGEYSINTFRLHNLYLEIASDSGIIGLLSYLSIIVSVIAILHKSIKSFNVDSNHYKTSLILFDITIATTIISFFGARGPYGKLFWFLLALTYYLSNMHNKKERLY